MLFKKQNTSLSLLVFLFMCPLFAQAESYLTVINKTNTTIQCASKGVDTKTGNILAKPDTIFPIEAGKESNDKIRDWSAKAIENQVICFWDSNKVNEGEALCTTNIVTVSGEFDKEQGKPIIPMQVSC